MYGYRRPYEGLSPPNAYYSQGAPQPPVIDHHQAYWQQYMDFAMAQVAATTRRLDQIEAEFMTLIESMERRHDTALDLLSELRDRMVVAETTQKLQKDSGKDSKPKKSAEEWNEALRKVATAGFYLAAAVMSVAHTLGWTVSEKWGTALSVLKNMAKGVAQ